MDGLALVASGLVFLAELGDKSRLLAIALAARYRPWPVFGGIAIAAAWMLGARPHRRTLRLAAGSLLSGLLLLLEGIVS